MAKAAAKKDRKTKSAKKKADENGSSETEPLSNFQDIEKTGRGSGEEEEQQEQETKDVPPKTEKAKTLASTIVKVKLDKKGFLTIISSKIQSDNSTKDDTATYRGRTIHPDLKMKFEALRIHLALLCNYASTQQIKDIEKYDPEKVEKFVVRGLSITGGGDERYVITGYRLRDRDNKAIILNTPPEFAEQTEEKGYRYIDDLLMKITELLEEVKMYESGEKVGDAQQTALDFTEDDPEDDE